MGYKRLPAKKRSKQIVETAIKLAKKRGYRNITRKEIADILGVTRPLISMYFGIEDLKAEVMFQAVRRGIPKIVAQGIVVGDQRALEASEELKAKAVQYIPRGA